MSTTAANTKNGSVGFDDDGGHEHVTTDARRLQRAKETEWTRIILKDGRYVNIQGDGGVYTVRSEDAYGRVPTGCTCPDHRRERDTTRIGSTELDIFPKGVV